MPTLNWIGKDKVINHHLDVPYRTLDTQYTFRNDHGPRQAQATTDAAHNAESDNLIIHGDNLEALKALLPRYESRVKCIYIDPPYNTGNEGWVYNDNVNDPKIKRWLNNVVGKEGEDLSRHDKWLCMMYPRLKLLHKLLAEDGFIFVSIDYNAEPYLRLLLTEIFGGANFRNCIAVRRGIKNVQAQFKDIAALSVGHEYILLYSKKPETRLPKLSKELEEEKAGKWDTFWRGTDRPTMRYELFGHNPDRGQWRWEENRAKKAKANLERYLTDFSDQMTLDDFFFDHLTATNEKLDFVRLSEDGVVQYYVPPQDSKLVSDNWMDILLSGSVTRFDTEKNVEIIERILKWICAANKDACILDSFAGSGTTAHAVLNLNRQDGGKRKFILVEMEDYAETITAERVRRVMLSNSTPPPQQLHIIDNQPDTESFSYCTLGEPLFDEEGNINPAVPLEKLREYVWFTETRQLYKPQSPVTHEDAGTSYWLGTCDDTAYYFCYEPEAVTTLNLSLLTHIRERAGQYIIYADACTLADTFLQQHRIIFKKIPRDISRL